MRLLAYQLADADIAATPEGLRKKLLVKGYVQQVTAGPSFVVFPYEAVLMYLMTVRSSRVDALPLFMDSTGDVIRTL